MLSPYALGRPGGVQGQVHGLSRALNALGHDVTVIGPADAPGTPFGLSTDGAGGAAGPLTPDAFVMGEPTGVKSNGSVAPVTVSPLASMRAERFVRTHHFDVLHFHEPLAPIASYAFMVHPVVPMVGTYHRAGVSRWVPILKPLVWLVGHRMQVRVAVSDEARATALRSSKGAYEVLFNGVDLQRLEAAVPARTTEPTVLFLGRHEARKGLGVLLEAFDRVERPAVLWVAGEGPETEALRRRHPESARVRWLGVLSEDERDERLRGADVLCAPSLGGESFGMVVLEGMAARCAVVASDLAGYRAASGGHALLVPPGDIEALRRALGVALADVAEQAGVAGADVLKAAQAHAEGWSMDRLAERYVDVYTRAIEAWRARKG
jgi:phosphatidylinositol alpha-mannosyltransferase